MTVISSSVFALIDQIAAAQTVGGVMEAYLAAGAEVRLPYAATAFYPPDPAALPTIIVDAMPAGWLAGYLDGHMIEGDLLTARTRASTNSFEWKLSDWDVAAMTPAQQRWRDHNLHYGILGGLIVMDFRRGENMVMVVCGPDGYLSRHDRLAMNFAGQEAMLRVREMAMPDYSPLSRRERECLQWLCAGKTDWEIGQILSLSEKTVNVYIERAKTKFNVKTRTQVVALAVRASLIAA